MDEFFVVVGLGNPGKEYDDTRHNIGFDIIDKIGIKLKVDKVIKKHRAVIGFTCTNNKRVILVKPQTYMNLSGESIRDIVNWYKVPMENLIIIYDDIDLDLGRIRIRKKGSAGSHNGMKSIIYQLQCENFPRIRFGIRDENITREMLANYVLSKFSKEELKKIEDIKCVASDAAICIINNGIDKAMNEYNPKRFED